MKNIFEAENTIEAHMISGLLEQRGIQSNINGEYLQGGVGDIQPQGFIQITVDENNYDAARKIIDEWESKQPSTDTSKNEKTKTSGFFSGAIIGLIIGIGLTFWVTSTPTYTSGIDHNQDGINDEIWTFKNNLLSKTEIDRNFDGDIDHIYDYNFRGILSKSKSDDDFDGVFESSNKFRRGNTYYYQSDTNGDGSPDYKMYLSYGVLYKIEIYSPEIKTPVKVQYYKLNKLVSAKYDSDLNGSFDTEYKYDEFEGISKKTKI
jgi:hypothetical protein